MLIPEEFAEAPVYDLLKAAAEGRVGIDHRWLRAILDRGEAAVPDLNRFAKENLGEYPVAVDEPVLMILRHLKSPASIPFFVEYLRQFGSDVPDEFVSAILPIREAALEPLIQLYGELEEDEAVEVAFCLAAFRIRDDRVFKILLERLEFDLTEGAIDLGLYGDPAARPALEKMMEQTDDVHLRKQLEQAVAELGTEQNWNEESFDIWEEFPETALPHLNVLDEPDLIGMLGAADADYRMDAANELARRDQPERVRLALLDRARTDESPEVRAKCWEALGESVEDHDEIFSALLERVRDESAPLVERCGAMLGLGPKANGKNIRPLVEQFYQDPQTRAAALGAMWRSLDRSFAKYFPAHIDDPDLEVQQQAITGVGHLGIHESAERLRKYFDDEDRRSFAVFAYALAVRAEVSPGRVRALMRRIEEAAGGFTEEEEEIVEVALDERLMLNGHKPVFHPMEDDEEVEEPGRPVKAGKVGRNDPCPCGSGRKYKKCCGA